MVYCYIFNNKLFSWISAGWGFVCINATFHWNSKEPVFSEILKLTSRDPNPKQNIANEKLTNIRCSISWDMFTYVYLDIWIEIIIAHPHWKMQREYFLYLYVCRFANDVRSFKSWGKSAIDSMIVTLPVLFFWGWKIIESPKDGLHWLFLGSQETQ